MGDVEVEQSVENRALSAVSEALVGAATDLSLDAVLERLVRAARDLVGARYAALGVPDGEGGFARFLTAGMEPELVESLGPLPRSHGLLDVMLTQTTPYRTDDVRRDPRFRGWWPRQHPEMRSFLGYPIVFKGDVIGAFYLTDKVGAPSFDDTDEHLIGIFAPHAAVLVEYARLYEESRELSIGDERNRIARELHDALTQTLFGARLAIKTATLALGVDDQPGAGPDLATTREQLRRATGLVNDAFGELRALILDLRPPDLETDRLCGAIRKQLALIERTSGLDVDLEVDDTGEIDDVVEPETERQLLRIVQEAVTNVVRHAQARSLTVSIGLEPESTVGEGGRDARMLRVEIRDDGVGFDPAERGIRSRRMGLTSMSDRVDGVGGELTIESSPGSGTTVRAEVPIG
jgi:signal transduction histidine kinase